jgi:hypothetical protein
MPTQVVVGDILSLRAWNTLDEQAAVNTYNFECISVTGAGVTDQEFANAQDAPVSSFYKAYCPTTVTYRGIQVYFIKRTTGFLPNPVSSVISSGAGTGSGNPTPRNTCAILKYATPVRGPGGRGRVFLPFMADSFVANNGRPTIAAETLINSLGSYFQAPLTVTVGARSGTFVWVLVKRPPHTVPTVTGQIVTSEAADKFGQQHKRGDYGRANASPI